MENGLENTFPALFASLIQNRFDIYSCGQDHAGGYEVIQVKHLLRDVTREDTKFKYSDEQRDNLKGRRNLRHLCEESLERSQEKRRKGSFNEEHRKAERNRARDKTHLQVLAFR